MLAGSMDKIYEINKEEHPGNPFLKARMFFYVFALAICGAAIYFFPEIKHEVGLIEKVNVYWMTAAVCLQACTYLISAVIYQLLLRSYKGPDVPGLSDLYKVSVVSLVFNQIIPSAGVSGNAFLFSYLKKQRLPAPALISLILTELLIFYIAIVFVIVFFLVLALMRRLPPVFEGVLLAGMIVYLLFSALIILTGRDKSFAFLYRNLRGNVLIGKRLTKWYNELNAHSTVQKAFKLFAFEHKDPSKVVLRVFVLQLLLFSVDIMTIAALFYGLGIYMPMLFLSVSFISTKIISILPFSPGSLILYESSMTYFFVTSGIPLGPAIMVTLLFRFLSFWLPIPAGLVLYRQWIHRQTG